MSQSLDTSTNEFTFFCVLCPTPLCFVVKTGLERHLREKHFSDIYSDETFAIEIWIKRHIRYQEKVNKCMVQNIKTIPDRNKTIYKGCPMCDNIIKVFNIKSDPKDCETHELLIKDINVDYFGDNINHINHHLSYYPYECLLCKDDVGRAQQIGEAGKDVVKTVVKAMMRRHIIDRHLKDTDLVGMLWRRRLRSLSNY